MDWNGKQHETEPSIYGKDQTTPNSLGTLRAATTGAPLPCGDALVTYENLKREKNSEGNENGEKKFDINVCRV
jgi:hypothetical protein